ALTTCEEVTIALAPGCPGTAMPYSVSMPITRRTVMRTPPASGHHQSYGVSLALSLCPAARRLRHGCLTTLRQVRGTAAARPPGTADQGRQPAPEPSLAGRVHEPVDEIGQDDRDRHRQQGERPGGEIVPVGRDEHRGDRLVQQVKRVGER